jgi:hypothetical protein
VRASGGLALEWVGDRQLAIADDRGVELYDLGSDAPRAVAGADGLVMARTRSACTPEPVESGSDVEEPEEN